MKALEQNREVGDGDGVEEARGIGCLGDDLLHNILSRLPAVPFAFACASCRTFRRVCARILCRPKLVSALSSNPCLEDAVEETLDKLLSEPIRPHFALVNVDYATSLEGTVKLITKRLGKGIPIICCCTNGVICCDVETGELKKVMRTKDGLILNMFIKEGIKGLISWFVSCLRNKTHGLVGL